MLFQAFNLTGSLAGNQFWSFQMFTRIPNVFIRTVTTRWVIALSEKCVKAPDYNNTKGYFAPNVKMWWYQSHDDSNKKIQRTMWQAWREQEEEQARIKPFPKLNDFSKAIFYLFGESLKASSSGI